MKILLISMHSIHATRWIENLKESSHELYWFDISNKGKLEIQTDLKQFTDWKKRKVSYFKGEHYLYKNHHKLYKKIQPYIETSVDEYFEKLINVIQPDLVHSFEMHSCSFPILKVMNKFPQIKWAYNCWGNDIFYYKNIPSFERRIRNVLKRVNYFVADCERDLKLADQFGFKGLSLGSLPTGGGYDLRYYNQFLEKLKEKNLILVKGYQHHLGRGLQIIKALETLKSSLVEYKVVVFGAHDLVLKYIEENKLDFEVYTGKGLNHDELLKIMGKSLIYVGNSISDGMPNTLLEAIIMGAFPIQSNPGRATSEIIEHNVNGLLIDNPESVSEITSHIKHAIQNDSMLKKAYEINQQIALSKLGFEVNKTKILNIYDKIDKN